MVKPATVLFLLLVTCNAGATQLRRPVVILISSDGFRFGYQLKTHTPNIDRLIAGGTEAETGLIPVFPTLTFPNHYSIVTGLYPPYHGIVDNYFVDPHTGERFTPASHDPKWWLGEPLWETLANHGLRAAPIFWPGSELRKGSWSCPIDYYPIFNSSVDFEIRVDSVLGFFDLSTEMPVLMTLYLDEPDHEGHIVGPDHPQITESVARTDEMVGRLIGGLEKKGVFEDVHIVFVGDHGMVGTCESKVVFLDDLAPWIRIPSIWVQTNGSLLAIRPPPGVELTKVVAKMNEGLGSGQVENGRYLKVYLKEEIPGRLHYVDSDRICPIIGLVEEGFLVKQNRTEEKLCGGTHGYDNALLSMRTVFVGHGPRFERGRKVKSFENVNIYNIIASILGIQGAPNNGSKAVSESLLLPTP